MHLKSLLCFTASLISTVPHAHSAPPVNTNQWPICSSSRRITCVVDGDTFWKDGIKYRLYGVDTPEAGENAKCSVERERARQATAYLQTLMSSGNLRLQPRGKDRYDRILVTVETAQGDAASELIRSRHAVPYRGGFRDKLQWCTQ